MTKSLAEAKGMKATFMPKPFSGLTGSGAHVHISLHDAATGKNLCGGGAASMHGLSDLALKFLGGMLTHVAPIAALGNPTINSYKRLNARGTAA